ncbi:hypothetical protein EPO56_01210 [Patescibacteria group bacterium]|nr:MAG: hypothetical protein EPO56_01210 [Patescibacteria group bacterium]
MNIFKNSTFTWWQIGLFKLSVATFGIAVGAYWQEFFLPYLTVLLTVAVVSGLYVGYIWLKQH